MNRWSIGLRTTLPFLVVLAAPPLHGQAPSVPVALLAEWKADLGRSANAPTLLESMTLTFSQRGDTLVLVQRAARPGAPAQLSTMRMLPNGASVENAVGPADKPFMVRTTATWDGKVLVVTSAGQVQGIEFNNTRHYRLEKGGKELAASVSTLVGGMRNEQDILFVKASAAGTTKDGER